MPRRPPLTAPLDDPFAIDPTAGDDPDDLELADAPDPLRYREVLRIEHRLARELYGVPPRPRSRATIRKSLAALVQNDWFAGLILPDEDDRARFWALTDHERRLLKDSAARAYRDVRKSVLVPPRPASITFPLLAAIVHGLSVASIIVDVAGGATIPTRAALEADKARTIPELAREARDRALQAAIDAEIKADVRAVAANESGTRGPRFVRLA